MKRPRAARPSLLFGAAILLASVVVVPSTGQAWALSRYEVLMQCKAADKLLSEENARISRDLALAQETLRQLSRVRTTPSAQVIEAQRRVALLYQERVRVAQGARMIGAWCASEIRRLS